MFNSRKIQKLIENQELTNRKIDALAVGLKTILENLSIERKNRVIEYKEIHSILYILKWKFEEFCLHNSKLLKYFRDSQNNNLQKLDKVKIKGVYYDKIDLNTFKNLTEKSENIERGCKTISAIVSKELLSRMIVNNNNTSKRLSSYIKKLIIDDKGNICKCQIFSEKLRSKKLDGAYIHINFTAKQYEQVKQLSVDLKKPMSQTIVCLLIPNNKATESVISNSLQKKVAEQEIRNKDYFQSK